ncbi:unnamed protein product [Spirodela intermedia]|uniref:DUF7894 domain-containing protein n=1 Tax=Spirodela intermedia TaxID=51605 RepID=A0A7I8IV78_SPIIN|nr:unnamed protein product [Spirodela intermedia]CAA6661532.1 unnamed protein product [Spirodela intermedia]
MRVARKVVILIGDEGGLGAVISDGLSVRPGSDLSREQSSLQLSLENYGVKDPGVSCSLIHFNDRCGSPQVLIILVPNFEPPVAACAVNEILTTVISENSSELPIIVVPIFQPSLKISQEPKKPKLFDNRVAIFGVEIGLVTDTTQAMLSGIPKPPSSLRLSCETSACLLQMIRVLNIPSLLIGTSIGQPDISAKAEDIQGVNGIGEFLANCTGLSFSKGKTNWIEREKSRSQEPWRALYG